MIPVLDLFSAAAGGWSLGMHRAGFTTVAACEAVAWRRALYSENNPGVPVYDDVCTLTADRLVRDLGYFPTIVVGSPPCQDISSANTKGKGVEGERSKLFFEAVRIIGEGRPRWFALENSANLRTRGADAVLAALEALGYTCWAVVVRARDVGANHERPRSWIIGCDLEQLADPAKVGREPWTGDDQGEHSRFDRRLLGDDLGNGDVTDADGIGRDERRRRRRIGVDLSLSSHPRDAAEDGRRQGRTWGCAVAATRLPVEARGHDANAAEERPEGITRGEFERAGEKPEHPNVASGCEVGGRTSLGLPAPEPWAGWNSGLATHLRLDDGLSTWLAGTRIAVGGPRGTSAASLIVEAFGDAVVPQIPEAIGRAILRVEEALAAVSERLAA